ncbi:DUF4440 domain-containing protein [Noviherbaspirillum humi]|uniref:DUF4440 domain-containing protein n=1 Tax=Noviherbaspirillum humi TaxID=1688639 RepID=UPI00116010C0|nr:DUF4440 domain-containing protein [Noviherbaspirillum humi]
MGIAVMVCIGYGIWHAAIGGKRVSDAQVRELYQQYWEAFDRGDAKAVCDLFSDQVHGRFSSTARSMPVTETLDKATACASVGQFHETKQRLEERVGKALYTNFEYTIKSIEISPDRKTATVEVATGMRIGTEQGALLDMRSEQTDVVKSSFGKAQFVQSDGTVSFFR